MGAAASKRTRRAASDDEYELLLKPGARDAAAAKGAAAVRGSAAVRRFAERHVETVQFLEGVWEPPSGITDAMREEYRRPHLEERARLPAQPGLSTATMVEDYARYIHALHVTGHCIEDDASARRAYLQLTDVIDRLDYLDEETLDALASSKVVAGFYLLARSAMKTPPASALPVLLRLLGEYHANHEGTEVGMHLGEAIGGVALRVPWFELWALAVDARSRPTDTDAEVVRRAAWNPLVRKHIAMAEVQARFALEE